MKPTVGRIVHYVAHGTPIREDGTQAFPPACRAAIVTEVAAPDEDWPANDQDQRVGLAVVNPGGLFFHPLTAGGCVERPAHLMAGGSWHWPERVEEPERPSLAVLGAAGPCCQSDGE